MRVRLSINRKDQAAHGDHPLTNEQFDIKRSTSALISQKGYL